MKLNTFSAHLVSLLGLPMSEFTELQRALKEQSAHFNPESELNKAAHQRAGKSGVGYDPEIFRGKAGPGGGIELDAFKAGFFLLAVTLNAPRKESAYTTWRAWHLPQEGSALSGWGEVARPTFAKCPFTGQHLLGEALKAIIACQDLAARVDEIRVTPGLVAEIHYDSGQVSRFDNRPYVGTPPRLYRIAVLNGLVIRIASQLIERED